MDYSQQWLEHIQKVERQSWKYLQGYYKKDKGYPWSYRGGRNGTHRPWSRYVESAESDSVCSC